MFYCMGPLPSYGRHRSFALFLGRPVCQLLYRMDVEICTGGGGEGGERNVLLSKQNLFNPIVSNDEP